MNFKTVQDTKSKHSNDGSLCSTYSQIIEATGEAYGLTQSSYALPAWRHPSEDTEG